MAKWEYALVVGETSPNDMVIQRVTAWALRTQGDPVRYPNTDEDKSLIGVLDGLGSQGWEAVSYTTVGARATILLKRPG